MLDFQKQIKTIHFFLKCQSPNLNFSFESPLQIFKLSSLISLPSLTSLSCSLLLENQKTWSIYKLIGEIEIPVILANNPTTSYADLTLQPNTLAYGLYKIVYTVSITIPLTKLILTSQIFTKIQIVPSGLVVSSLKTSQAMYGGTIAISRGGNQSIEFDPFLHTYDIDGLAVITSLMFNYTCQIIQSNVQQGYPRDPVSNQIIYLADINMANQNQYLACFNKTGEIFV